MTHTVVDTGPLVALVDADDAHHLACRKWYDSISPKDLIIPAPVIAEACYLIGKYLGARVESAFLLDLAHRAYGTVIAVMPEDLLRMSVLVGMYASLPLGGTDACVVAVAERLDTVKVATIDRRHFSVVRPAHAPGFELYPA